MKRVQAIIIALLGAAVIKASVSGLYLRYVKAGMQPLLIGAGILLVATGLMTLWYDLRQHQDDHDHTEPRVSWFLLAPVFALLLLAPPALGSYAAARSGSALTAAASDYPPLPDGDPVRLSVLDYASRAVFDSGKTLGSRRIELSGFVLLGPDGQPYLARMLLTCCAADARPIKVALTGELPDSPQPDQWLDVVGMYRAETTTDDVNGAAIPYLNVQTWAPIAAPAEQYET